MRDSYVSQLMGVYEFASKRNRKKILRAFRRTVKFPVRHAYWKTEILLNMFFIHPRLYEWFFIEHRQNVRALERRFHIKYGDMPVRGNQRGFYA